MADVAHAEVCVRPAHPDDARPVAELFIAARKVNLPYLPELHTDDETRGFIRDVVFRDCGVWVAEVRNVLAGFVATHGEWLEHLYVHPDWQGRGAGTALLAKAKALHPGGLRLWVFQRNTRARRFYESHGFQLARTTDGAANEEREPDAEYVWRPSVECRG